MENAGNTLSPPRTRGRPGPKPGQKHAGQFKKGFDERRWVEGPTKVKREFRVAIQDSAEQAVAVLDEILCDPSAPVKERRQAAELVLAHAHGMPVNRVLHAQTGHGSQRPENLDMDQLLALANDVVRDRVDEVCIGDDDVVSDQ
jgi:hypothetical protein